MISIVLRCPTTWKVIALVLPIRPNAQTFVPTASVPEQTISKMTRGVNVFVKIEFDPCASTNEEAIRQQTHEGRAAACSDMHLF